VVVVTGASSGIGRRRAGVRAQRGAAGVGARRLDRLNAVAQMCLAKGSPDVSVRRLDVGQRADARAFVAGCGEDHDRIDVLVNNAGVGWMGRLHEMPEDKVEELVATNLRGVIATPRPHCRMLERRSGVIINVSSLRRFRAAPYSAVYSATKHADRRPFHALRGELSGDGGVKVCVVYPA